MPALPTHRARLLSNVEYSFKSGLTLRGPCTVLVVGDYGPDGYVSGYLWAYSDSTGDHLIDNYDAHKITLGPGWVDIVEVGELEFQTRPLPLRF